MQRALVPALLLLVVSLVLGATAFRDQVASAGPAPKQAGDEPVQAALQWNFSGGSVAQATYAVPAGKLLRIELVTFHDLNRPVGLNRFGVRTQLGGSPAVTHWLSSSTQASGGDVVTEAVELYADPGTTVTFSVILSAPLGGGGVIHFMHGSISGVLIDAS
jgi:hypothetical protein